MTSPHQLNDSDDEGRHRRRSKYHRYQLDSNAWGLFISPGDESAIFLPIRDFDSYGAKLSPVNCTSEEQLREVLGEDLRTTILPDDPSWLKPDPKCRVILLESPHPGSRRLNVTRSMFMRLMTYHQVSSNYLSFISSFGTPTRSLGFGGFRSEVSLDEPQFVSGKLGRSGKQIKLSYSLETIQRNLLDQVRNMKYPGDNDPDPDSHIYWLRPQAAIHHQFDTETGASLWIITSPLIPTINELGKTVERSPLWHDYISSYLKSGLTTTNVCLEGMRRSLEIHVRLIDWAVGECSSYIQYVDENMEHLARKYLYVGVRVSVDEEDIRRLYNLTDDTDTCIVRLEDNLRVLESLSAFYQEHFSSTKNCLYRDDVDNFCSELRDRKFEMESLAFRARALASLARSRESVMTKFLQNQSNLVMLDLAKRSHEETVVMGLFQTIALFYLPITVVSAVFSTDIVKFQDLEPGQTHSWSPMALWSWVVTSAGLTIVTVAFSEVWKRWKRNKLLTRLKRQQPIAREYYTPPEPEPPVPSIRERKQHESTSILPK
ncbi:hypothetical protein PG987_010978 [Apiospora arundinis]